MPNVNSLHVTLREQDQRHWELMTETSVPNCALREITRLNFAERESMTDKIRPMVSFAENYCNQLQDGALMTE